MDKISLLPNVVVRAVVTHHLEVFQRLLAEAEQLATDANPDPRRAEKVDETIIRTARKIVPLLPILARRGSGIRLETEAGITEIAQRPILRELWEVLEDRSDHVDAIATGQLGPDPQGEQLFAVELDLARSVRQFQQASAHVALHPRVSALLERNAAAVQRLTLLEELPLVYGTPTERAAPADADLMRRQAEAAGVLNRVLTHERRSVGRMAPMPTQWVQEYSQRSKALAASLAGTPFASAADGRPGGAPAGEPGVTF